MIDSLRRLRGLALGAALVFAGTGCSSVLGSDDLTVSAEFDDVIDLVPRGSVRLNDVIVGQIDSIELTDDMRARVVMSIDPDAPVPANVEAVLAKTSVLGERYVALQPMGEPAGRLEDETEITQTSIRSDLEDLMASGSDLLGVVSSETVRVTIQTAADTFGGRAGIISGFIDDVNSVLSTYDDSTDDLLALVDSLDDVAAAYAPNAEDNAAVLADLRAASEALQTQDERLLDTLDDATILADEAAEFLGSHQDQLANTIRRARELLDQIVIADSDVRAWLEFLPRHFLFVPMAEVNFQTVVWLDFIVCGVNETDGDVTRDCTPPNPGRRGEDPGIYPVPEECFDDPEPCQNEAAEG